MALVEIYCSMLCPYCHQAKGLLDRKGIEYEETDVLMKPAKRAEMVERAGGRTSVPQIFIDGKHIGGSDELHALEDQGALDGLLQAS